MGNEMYLYCVNYRVWNNSFSGLLNRTDLSVGSTGKEAIVNLKARNAEDSRDFEATRIENVMGYKIIVQKIKSK